MVFAPLRDYRPVVFILHQSRHFGPFFRRGSLRRAAVRFIGLLGIALP
jgi:hypothetical protein